MGQGIATVMIQMAAEETGLPAEMFVHEAADTLTTPNSGTSNRQPPDPLLSARPPAARPAR